MATKWFKIGSRRPQDIPRWLQVGQDGRELAQSGSKRGPRSATWAKMALKLIQQGLKITSLSYFVPTLFIFFFFLFLWGALPPRKEITYISISFPFLPFHFLSFPFLCFAFLSFPTEWGGSPKLYIIIRVNV